MGARDKQRLEMGISTSLVQRKRWKVHIKMVGGGHNLAIFVVEGAVISLKVFRKGGYPREIFPTRSSIVFGSGSFFNGMCACLTTS